MNKLDQKPHLWLTTKISKDIFDNFSHLIQFDEPIPPFDSRFPGKLEGILESIRQTFGGQQLNPAILDAASAYLNQIVRGHPFTNGNKRIAILLTHVFLLVHGIDFTLSYKGLYNLVVALVIYSDDFSNEQTKSICKVIIRKFSKEIP